MAIVSGCSGRHQAAYTRVVFPVNNFKVKVLSAITNRDTMLKTYTASTFDYGVWMQSRRTPSTWYCVESTAFGFLLTNNVKWHLLVLRWRQQPLWPFVSEQRSFSEEEREEGRRRRRRSRHGSGYVVASGLDNAFVVSATLRLKPRPVRWGWIMWFKCTRQSEVLSFLSAAVHTYQLAKVANS